MRRWNKSQRKCLEENGFFIHIIERGVDLEGKRKRKRKRKRKETLPGERIGGGNGGKEKYREKEK